MVPSRWKPEGPGARFRLGGAEGEGAAKSEFVEGEGWVATSDDAMVQQLFEENFAPVSILGEFSILEILECRITYKDKNKYRPHVYIYIYTYSTCT